ncbi:hypothetical protein JCM10213v2_002772 [Rhodosporidiobolus nylandii]
MGFFKELFSNPEDRERRRRAKHMVSSTNLAGSTHDDGSPSYVSSAYASTSPTSPTKSIASRTSGDAQRHKRSSSPIPPVPPIPGLPSDRFALQETVTTYPERERRERERATSPGRRPSPGRPSGGERNSPSRHGHSAHATTAQNGQALTAPSPRSSPRTREVSHPFSSYRVGGLVAAVPEERESATSDDGSSTHRRERELVRDYEAAMTRGMERLNSSSSIGGVSAVSGLSGVKGWGEQKRDNLPFHGTVEDGKKLSIIVVGSGFGAGYQVTVVERGSGLSPHGDLITLGSNCTRLLARWGLFTDFWKRSAKGGHWVLKSHTGEMLGGQDLRDFPQLYGSPLMQGHRAQYLGVLGVEARMLMVGFKPNNEVIEYRDAEPDGSGKPSIVTARGETLEADLIVVCDGVNSYGYVPFSLSAPPLPLSPRSLSYSTPQEPGLTSPFPSIASSYAKAFLAPELGGSLGNLREDDPEAKLQKSLDPDTPDEGKQYSVHRAAMMADKLRDDPRLSYFLDGCMRTFVGPDSHLKIAPLDENRQVSFTYLSRSRYAASTNWRDRRPVKEVTDALEKEGWDPTVIEAVKAFRTCLNWAVSEAPPAGSWCTASGKIILIGDAVHALSPLSFQGGSQAIEDGAALAVCLALAGGKPEDVPRATRAFEAMRKPRVTEAQVRGTKQRELWHSYYDTKAVASLDLNITEAYHHDAELHAVSTFERTVQTHLGERDFAVDPKVKKDVLRRLEVNGPAQREAEAEMMDPDFLWERGGVRPAR